MAELKQWQQNLKDILTARGFDDDTIEQKFLLLAEEVGELAKAIRKSSGVKMADNAKQQNLQEEVADVFILLVAICNKLDIDLEDAVIMKEKLNEKRVWS